MHEALSLPAKMKSQGLDLLIHQKLKTEKNMKQMFLNYWLSGKKGK